MAKLFLDPHAPNTNFILGAALSGGNIEAAAEMIVIEKKPAGDEHMGKYVYCMEHMHVHATGWCTVLPERKVALEAQTPHDARIEAQDKGLDDIK